MLLVALSGENYLKGNLVSKVAALSPEGRFAHASHKLLALVERTKLSITYPEADFIERLEVFLEWAGRYPIPLKSEDLLPRTMPEGGFAMLTYVKSSDRTTWERLKPKLQGG